MFGQEAYPCLLEGVCQVVDLVPDSPGEGKAAKGPGVDCGGVGVDDLHVVAVRLRRVTLHQCCFSVLAWTVDTCHETNAPRQR